MTRFARFGALRATASDVNVAPASTLSARTLLALPTLAPTPSVNTASGDAVAPASASAPNVGEVFDAFVRRQGGSTDGSYGPTHARWDGKQWMIDGVPWDEKWAAPVSATSSPVVTQSGQFVPAGTTVRTSRAGVPWWVWFGAAALAWRFFKK